MNLANFIYIACISMQLSAGLLLVGNTTTSRTGIIKEYCDRHTAIAFNTDGSLADSEDLKKTVRMTWINHTAFSYLTCGYLLSVLGEIPNNKLLAMLIILACTALLIWFPVKIANKKSKSFEEISIEDIPLQDGVEYVILE